MKIVGKIMWFVIGAALMIYADRYAATPWPFWTVGVIGVVAPVAKELQP